MAGHASTAPEPPIAPRTPPSAPPPRGAVFPVLTDSGHFRSVSPPRFGPFRPISAFLSRYFSISRPLSAHFHAFRVHFPQSLHFFPSPQLNAGFKSLFFPPPNDFPPKSRFPTRISGFLPKFCHFRATFACLGTIFGSLSPFCTFFPIFAFLPLPPFPLFYTK